MKLFFTLLFIALALNSPAQKIRFSDSTNQWTTLSVNGDGCTFQNSFFYGNDTVVNGITYRSLQGPGNSFFGYHNMCYCGLLEYANQYHFGVREDTAGGLVYCIDLSGSSGDTVDQLLYNYNLHVGDSIVISGYTDSLASMDSTIINGVYHKIFNMQNKALGSLRRYTVLEGVGCTNDPVFPASFHGCFEWGESLLCFWENGIRPVAHAPINSCSVYSGCYGINSSSFDNTTGCGGLLSASDITQSLTSITITPNPAFDHIDITANGQFDNNTSVSVYEISGRCVLKTQANDLNNTITINTSYWSNGLYMILVQNNNGIIKKEKVVIIK